MYTITYNLRGIENQSVQFYEDLSAYSEKVFKELDEQLFSVVYDYQRYVKTSDRDKMMHFEESYLELLSLGVYWVVYSGDALATDQNATELLTKLGALRESSSHLKPFVDAFRGVCLTSMMSPDLYDHMGVASPTKEHLETVVSWLKATGEFNEEVKGFDSWKRFVGSLEPIQATGLLELVISTGLWFVQDSVEGLGKYTENVDRYLNEMRPDRYWKEDVIFCGRRRVEYHLNMVGSQWLNKAYRKSFLEKPNKIVLLPTCMRLLPAKACKAEPFGGWLKCQICNCDCQVGQISAYQRKYGFELYMVPHSSSLKDSPLTVDINDVGIIGVSCVLNLISGGLMLRSLHVPAQCVILDYCGCKTHWHYEGIPTALNMERLLDLLTEEVS